MVVPGEPTGIAGLGHGLHLAVRAVVHDALSIGAGHTLPTNVVYRDTLGLGAGTLQRALDVLRDRGALTVTSRGHLGRVVDAIDVGQCWQVAGLAAVRLLLPPSGPIEIEVLEGRIAEELTRLGIPHTVKHQPGGERRLTATYAGEHDLAVVSAGTFDSSSPGNGDPSPGAGPSPTLRLPAGTYYAPGRLVIVRRAAQDEQSPIRVAIDRNSPDHVALTLGEFSGRDDVVLIEAPFPAVPAWVLRNTVDLGIWHVSRSVIPLDLAGLRTGPLTSDARDAVSGAVLAASPARPELRSVLAAFDLTGLLDEQRQALADDQD